MNDSVRRESAWTKAVCCFDIIPWDGDGGGGGVGVNNHWFGGRVGSRYVA